MTDRDLAQAIAIALEKFLANADPTDAAICKLASLHSVLPTVRDWSAFVGLTPDREVVFVDFDPSHEVTPANEQARHAGRIAASQQWPELHFLGRRDENSVDCPGCGGTGQGEIEKWAAAQGVNNLRCVCHGAGWVPKSLASRYHQA